MNEHLTSVEVCAGAGGQALGLEAAGFDHLALVDNDPHCCATLQLNRPGWNVCHTNLEHFDGRPYAGTDLLSGGLPCPPFSVAGKQLGENDDRNLFPAFFRLVREIQPKAVLIENVKGFLDPVFSGYRQVIKDQFTMLGYACEWRLFNAKDFGVSQSRPRVAIVAMPHQTFPFFNFPLVIGQSNSVGTVLNDLMGANGWHGTADWSANANTIAPTIVGGSKKHGGPDLGPTRARQAWAGLGVDGRTIAEQAPDKYHSGLPRLTVRMVARLQGFPDDWQFSGKKTPAYRQVGNAFPPPLAKALGDAIATALGEIKAQNRATFNPLAMGLA